MVLIRLRGCAGWSGSLLFACGIRHVFAWPGPYDVTKALDRQWKIETVWANAWQNQQNDVLSAKTDQPVYPSSLIRVLAVRMKKPWILSYLCSAKRRFEWGWADALAVLSLRCVHRSLCPQLQRSWRGILVSGCPLRSTRTVHARALNFKSGFLMEK